MDVLSCLSAVLLPIYAPETYKKLVCDIFLGVCREDLYNSQSAVNLISIALQGLFSTQARAIKAKNIKHVRGSGVKKNP